MLEKIRYRLVYNRQKKLNKQGTALVQVEAYLNQRKAYFKANREHKLLTILRVMNSTQCYMVTYWICRR